MINIEAPNTHIEEIKYVCSVIFQDFLGIEYLLNFKERKNYCISFNEKYFILKDTLFGNYSNYLTHEAIPNRIDFFENTPIIYGENIWGFFINNIFHEDPDYYQKIKSNNTKGDAYCGLDLFGSIFFMISRFEEYLISPLDEFNRVSSKDMIAVKFGFEKKAIVHEYTEIIWKLLINLNSSLIRKSRKFELVLTHDIDHLFFWKNYKFFFTRLKKCLFKYKNFKQASKEIYSYISVQFKLKKDPYDKIDFLMDMSEELNIKSVFYFLVGQKCSKDFDSDLKKLTVPLEKIKKREHIIALHPSYLSSDNSKFIEDEKKLLQKMAKCEIYFSRQHYLRFNIPQTFSYLEKIGIKYDSSLGFTDRVGFRSGCCYPYKLFDFIQKKSLNLQEHPLIAMDGAIIEMDREKAKKEILAIMKEVQRYNGNMVLLWHNSSFEVNNWEKFYGLYEEILKEIKV